MTKRTFLLPLLSFLCFAAHAQTSIVGRGINAIDGDTLTILGPRNARIRISLAGIDAPGRKQPFGPQSRKSLASLCVGQPVVIYDGQKNRYGHLFGNVYCAGVDVASEQIKRGLAWAQEPASPLYEKQYLAQSGKIGLWAEPNPVSPWDFRNRKKK